MSSSSRRLIHPDQLRSETPGAEAFVPAPSVPAPSSVPAASGAHAAVGASHEAGTVLRGRGRTTSVHPSLAHIPVPAVQGGLPGALAAAGIDPAELSEQLERLEAEAASRGYEAGHARAEGELRAAILAAGAVSSRMQEVAPDRTADIAHAIAELALSVARRILQHEVRTDPTILCAALEAAVGTINGSPEAHVLLNPAAVEPVRLAWEALHGRAYLGKRWTFEGDPNLPAGGCTLRYDHGFVEAGLEAQLEEIGIALDRAIPALSRTTVEEEVA